MIESLPEFKKLLKIEKNKKAFISMLNNLFDKKYDMVFTLVGFLMLSEDELKDFRYSKNRTFSEVLIKELNKFDEHVWILWGNALHDALEIEDNEKNDEILLSQLQKDYNSKVFNSMLSVDYVPPDDINEICAHLVLLWMCFRFKELPLMAVLILEFSLLKLMLLGSSLLSLSESRAYREYLRQGAADEKTKEKRSEMKRIVYDIYYNCGKIGDDTSFHMAAKIIQKEFRKWVIDGKADLKILLKTGTNIERIDIDEVARKLTPGLTTIKTYLKENPEIKKHFDKVKT